MPARFQHKLYQGLRRRGDIVAPLIIFTLLLLLAASNIFTRLDNIILEKNFEALSHNTSSDAVIIAIDTKSLQAMPGWPWPRAVHGDLVDKLSEAGVSKIAFDVDFSAPGEPQSDQQFSHSILNSTAPVYLAAFRQSLSNDISNIYAEITPNLIIREHARLAAVNYPIDEDGVVRRAADSVTFSFGRLASIAYAMAGARPKGLEYGIDYSLHPDSFKTYSYIDILNGNFDPAELSGKAIFVGATALELGDEYVMPAYGVRSGVLINALSYETVKNGKQVFGIGNRPSLILALALIIFLTGKTPRRDLRAYLVINAFIATLLIIGPLYLLSRYSIAVPSAGLYVSQILCIFFAFGSELEKRARLAFYGRMEARDHHALLQTLISDNHEGFIVTNANGVIELHNARAAELLNVDNACLKGRNVGELHPALLIDDEQVRGVGVINHFPLYLDQDMEREDRAIDVTVSRSEVPVIKSRFERRNANRVFIVYALHDITVLKRAEKAEREAKETHASISAAKTQFISTMSHELRTPLNAINGFSTILKEQSFGPLGAPEYSEYAGLIHTSGANLLYVLNDMLFAAQLQAGELSIECDELSFSELIQSSLDQIRTRSHWRNPTLHLELDPVLEVCRADWSSLLKAVTHLIDNAVKFGGENATIRIQASVQNNDLALTVRDNGVGCAAEETARLGEMFHQVDAGLNRNYEGCGLGLYIAKEVAALHSGTLTFETAPGEGFTAKLIVPNAAQAESACADAA